MMPEGKGGVCYKQGLVVRENYQMCNVTNRKILDQLKGDLPQVSFSCNAEKKECNFQCKSPLELLPNVSDSLQSGSTRKSPSIAH